MEQTALPGYELFSGVTSQQVAFAKLVALGYDPKNGDKIKSLTHAAILAGVGSTKDSSRILASRYNKSPKIIKLIAYFRGETWEEDKLHHSEILSRYRDLADKCLGNKYITLTIEGDGDKEPTEVEYKVFKPSEAQRALSDMADMAGLKGAKAKDDNTSWTGVSGIESRELSGTERAARVIQLLKSAGSVGAG
jgi:hypothetical protein